MKNGEFLKVQVKWRDCSLTSFIYDTLDQDEEGYDLGIEKKIINIQWAFANLIDILAYNEKLNSDEIKKKSLK